MFAQAQESTNVLVGQSPRIRTILRLVEKLGRCRWPVLLLGETGTGKEVVARSIHNVSPLGPFVTIDCSSLVGPLMESELFGHVKGAFTGAVGTKTGLIERPTVAQPFSTRSASCLSIFKPSFSECCKKRSSARSVL